MEVKNFKNSTQEILTLVNDNTFLEKIKNLESYFSTYNRWNIIWDSSIWEIKEKLNSSIVFLKKYKNLTIVDNYSQNKRNTILSCLQNTNSSLQNISNGSNQTGQLLTQTEQMFDILYIDIILDKDIGKYNQDLWELRKLKKEYNNLSVEIIWLLKNKDTVEWFSKQIPEVQTKLQNAEQSFLRIKDIETNIMQKESEIKAFWESVTEYKTNYNEILKNYEDLAVKNDEKTDEIILKNESIQKKVLKFLEQTIWWKSSEELNKRADQIKWKWRLRWLIITTVTFLLVWLRIFWGFGNKWLEISWLNEWQILTIRISILLPLILFDIFIYSEYNSAKKLQEEYRFKAIISWTLETFVQLLKEHDNRQLHKDFIIETANRIFSNPINDNKSNNKIIQKFGEKILSIWEKVVDKTIDKSINNIMDEK